MLGPSDPLTSNGSIVVNPSSVCFLFGPRNPLTSNGRIVVKPSCVGDFFELRSPITGFGRMTVSLRKPWLFCCESHIHAWNMA